MNGVRIAIMALLVSIVAAAPAAAQGVFAGTWKVVDAQVAGWAKPSDAARVDPNFAHATFVFKEGRLVAPSPFNCKAHYKISTVDPGYLFQGAFDQDDPAGHAKALGFTGDKITNLEFACLRNDADIEMDFHLVDHDTIVFGFNNIIYRMKRQPGK